MIDRDLFSGMVRLHVLHHADEGPVFGLAIIEELRRHGYDISAGTMYPILHGLERKGYLVSRSSLGEGRQRRVYTITPLGRQALEIGRRKVKELFGELVGDPHGNAISKSATLRRVRSAPARRRSGKATDR